MDENIRVCHVVNTVDTTSIPADIASALLEHTDVEAGILAWFHAEPFDGSDEVSVHCVDAPHGVLGVNPRVLRETYDILNDYDIVQTHHPHSGTYAKPIAKLRRKKVVSTEQNSHVAFTRKGLVANAVTNVLADEVTCISDAVRSSLHWWERALLNDDHVQVIHNGVDLDRIRRSKDDDWSVYEVAAVDPNTVLVGNAAMFSEQKAHDTLVRAISRAREEVNIELVLAGDGEKRDRIEQLGRQEGIEDAVHFLGLIERQRVYRLMAEVDIYAMPSRWEGFCVAVAEAMATRTPCLLSDIEVFRELYDGAARFHPVDDYEVLADELLALVRDDGTRTALASRGRTLVENHYALDKIAKRYASMYREIL